MLFKPQFGLKLTYSRQLKFSLALMLAIQTFVAAAQTNMQIDFQIKPNRCLLENLDDECQFTGQFYWQANEQIEQVCLWQEQTLLQCWQNQLQAQWQTELNLTKTTHFILTKLSVWQPNSVLAHNEIQVLTQEPIKYRRRLHSQWSLF